MNCLNPKTIYNKYLKRYVTVPCQDCECCRIQKQNILALRCSNECKQHLRNVFFTLTYTNNYVPILRPHSNIILLRRRNIKVSRQRVKVKDFKDGLLSFKPVSGSIIKSYEFKDSFEVIDYEKYKDISLNNISSYNWQNDIDNIAHGRYTGTLSHRDINLFLKRMRYAISKTEFKNETLRYILIGEYGGTGNRPHYHGIWHTNNVRFADWLVENTLKVWRMADINAMSKINRFGRDGLPKIVDSTSVCSYVTKYVSLYNSNVNGSKQEFPVKPFLHTSKFPYYGLSSFDKVLVESFFQNDNPSFERLVKSGDKFINIVSPMCLQNRLMYRFDGIDKLNDFELCHVAFRNFEDGRTPKGRFSRNIIKRCRDAFPGTISVTFSQLYEYIKRVRQFITKLTCFHIKLQMLKPFNLDYLVSHLDSWSDVLHVKDVVSSKSSFTLLLESLYQKFLDYGLELSDSLFDGLANILYQLPIYQMCVLHDYRAKYRKQLLGKHLSNLKF